MTGSGAAGRHVFISYVRQDSAHAERLHGLLEAAGIPVWRDVHDLWPGQDWRVQVRDAITRHALVFLACFSCASLSRAVSYQNEELLLAIEQLRRRRQDDPWLIPVRFDDCQIPDLDVGGGRTLASIQGADLFGEGYDENAKRLISSIMWYLGSGREQDALAGRPGSRLAEPGHDLAAELTCGLRQVVIGEIPREPPAFVGRAALADLARAASSGRVAVVCAVTGLRGVGKTQLAAAHARDRISAGWELVGWVSAETDGSLLADLARVAHAVGVADPDGDSAESAARLREHLTIRAGRSLLVFDNATDPDRLRRFLPSAGRTVVVITSVDRAFIELGTAVDVPVFDRAQSVAYLESRTGQADPHNAGIVADELGDLPLGVAQAAATIRDQHLTYRQYLDRLHRAPAAELLARVPGGDYPQATAAALLLNVQAAEIDPAGLTGRVLRAIAVLSPDGVPRNLLSGLVEGDRGAEAIDAVAGRCVTASLLTWSVNRDALIMHRLVSRVLRERDRTTGEYDSTIGAVLDLLEPHFFDEDQGWARRHEGADLADQIQALWSAGADTERDELMSRLLRARTWVVQQLRAAADLTRAVDLGIVALADSGRILGPSHPQTLAACNNLARAYRSAGRLDQAIELYERALPERERVLGSDHPDTLTTRNNLAYAYQAAGQLDQAVELYGRILADRQRTLDPDHLDILTSRNNLARVYRSMGRLGDAIPLYQQTLADTNRILGSDHPQSLSIRNNLAYAYLTAGRLDEAIALYYQTLSDRERILGPEHPDTLTSRNNLARAYRSGGRLSEAIELYEQTLADRERILGPDHPESLTTRNNLAYACHEAGRLSEAIELYEQTLADRERILAPDHPQILTSRNNLARAYRSADRLSEAIELYEQTLADRERVLGPDHPQTFITRNNLAYAYMRADQPGRAIALHQKTLADRERVLGPDHPQILTSRNNLARAYRSADRLSEAIELHEQTLADRERILSAGHPQILTSRNHLAEAYQSAGRLSEAIELYERILADRELALGPDHPDTIASRENLQLLRKEIPGID
jgi:tetratricopeptide (TPR) repeat protein